MATAGKRKATQSTDGMAIKVVETATPGTAIHTAVAGTTAGTFDEIYIWAYNGHTSAVILSIEFGGAELPITLPVPSKSGLVPVIPGLILQNARVIRAFASVANVVTVLIFVNSITD